MKDTEEMKDPEEQTQDDLQPFIVEIEEHYHRGVIVWARNEEAAEKCADTLYAAGEIDLFRNCFAGNEINCTGIAEDNDLKFYDQYWTSAP